MGTDRLFLEYSANKLEQQTGRIRSCLEKLTEDQIWARGTENENAAGNIVLHLCGNVRQWIGHGVAGKPDIRMREREFNARGGVAREELVERLEGVVAEAAAALRGLDTKRLTERVTIQAYEVSVLEAIFHVVEHFSYHAGQIIFATKALTGEDLGFYRHLGAAGHSEKTP